MHRPPWIDPQNRHPSIWTRITESLHCGPNCSVWSKRWHRSWCASRERAKVRRMREFTERHLWSATWTTRFPCLRSLGRWKRNYQHPDGQVLRVLPSGQATSAGTGRNGDLVLNPDAAPSCERTVMAYPLGPDGFYIYSFYLCTNKIFIVIIH